MTISEEYLKRADAAAALGVHIRTLSRWHELRTGPRRVRVGKNHYYKRSDLLAWVEKQALPC